MLDGKKAETSRRSRLGLQLLGRDWARARSSEQIAGFIGISQRI
jgi:hypothetical protein